MPLALYGSILNFCHDQSNYRQHKVFEQTLCALEQPTEGWRKTDAVASGAQPTAKRLAKQPSPNGLV